MHQSEQLHQLLLSEVKRRLFEESIPRIKKCLNWITEEEVWQRPNERSNSIGNLILHLCGNVRQWVIAGIGKEADVRERQKEFDERGTVAKFELIQKLDELEQDVLQVLSKVSTADLIGVYSVQGYRESGVSILVHVVEHFSYHTGQITFYVKAMKNMDTGYYEGHNLDQTS